MFIFVINCGSSSVKAKLFKANSHTNEICSAKVEAIGLPRCTLSFSSKEKSLTGPLNCKNHTEAIENILHGLQNHNVLNNLKEIILVGHRVVHGGENYTNPTIITKTVLKTIDSLSLLAPLHNPVNIKGIEAAQTFLPHATNIAVFDTAFHHTIPKEAFLYGLPLEFYEKQGIRKYGFHGISTKYVSEKARQLSPNLSELIVCHLGNGSSITAVKDGNSIETSMGYSPLDGIIMGSRSGELDPEVVLHILRQGTYTVDTLTELLNKKSGLFGISAVSTDIRDLKEAADNGNKRAE
ncbi:acetate kinase, partial [Candidatus Woesearchaeota archaeon]|nr:acetate kinase [Candidatus Woesearchaeota archaeon]